MEENERTLYENLEYLNETKGIIKQAIIDKGVEVSADTPFREYADKIGDIQTGGGSGDVKLFNTVAEMEADPTAQEGDLALVYVPGTSGIECKNTPTSSISFSQSLQYTYLTKTTDGVDVKISLTSFLIPVFTLTINDVAVLTFRKTSISSTVWQRQVYNAQAFIGNTIIVTQEMTSNLANICMFLNQSQPTLASFTGIYEYKDAVWQYASTDLDRLTPALLMTGVTAYGNNGLVTGDGSIWNDLPMTDRFRAIHNSNTIQEESGKYIRLSNLDNCVSLGNTSIPKVIYCKYNDAGNVAFTEINGKYSCDVSGYTTLVAENNDYAILLPTTPAGNTTTLTGKIYDIKNDTYRDITIAGGNYAYNSSSTYNTPIYNTKMYGDYAYIMAIDPSTVTTPLLQMSRVNLKTGDINRMTYVMPNVYSLADYPMLIFDEANGRIYISMTYVTSSTTVRKLLYTELDYWYSYTELYSSERSGTSSTWSAYHIRMAIDNTYLFMETQEDGANYNMRIYKLSDLSLYKSFTYNWNNLSGPLCMLDYSIYPYYKGGNGTVVFDGTYIYSVYTTTSIRRLNINTLTFEKVTVDGNDKYYKPYVISYDLTHTYGTEYQQSNGLYARPYMPVTNNWSTYVEGYEEEMLPNVIDVNLNATGTNYTTSYEILKCENGYTGYYYNVYFKTDENKYIVSDANDYDAILIPAYFVKNGDSTYITYKYKVAPKLDMTTKEYEENVELAQSIYGGDL